MRKCIALLAIAGTAGSALAGGTVLGRDVSTDAGIFLSRTSNLGSTFTNGNLDTWGGGDAFGIMTRNIGVGNGVPFDLLDDSVSIFTGDTIGIIAENDNDPFFGIEDVLNAANPNSNAVATWSFDVAGYTGLEFSADFAAMGDFEAGDGNLFEYRFDGAGAWTTFLSTTIDEAGFQDYTLDSGAITTLNDPMLLNGVMLTNEFVNFSEGIAGSGSILEIRLTSTMDAGGEVFAFRNLEITGVPAPSSLALLGLGGFAATRRRRA